jgi:hypothetical protein
MTCGESATTRSVKRRLSTVKSCDTLTTEGLGKPEWDRLSRMFLRA